MRWTEEEFMEYMASKGNQVAKNKPKKRPKYSNKRTWIDGYCFHSKKEGEFYNQLKLLLKAEAIKGFCLQPEFVLVEGNAEDRAITYKADFIIFHLDGRTEIVDVKGYETEQWKRTLKMFKNKYPELEINVLKEV